MSRAHLGELLLLAALWGASFLFLRLGASEFGPVALAAVRVSLAAACLLPLLIWRGHWRALWTHWRPIAMVAMTNSALPFVCFAYAALTLSAGLQSIFNATVPLFGAVIAWVWLKDRLTALRVLGLLIGFGGVAYLALDKASFQVVPSGPSTAMATAACLVATVMYGWSGSFTKKYLMHLPSLAVATGSQVFSALALAIPAWLWWPSAAPSTSAWGAVVALAVVSTAFAYVLFFRLIVALGPATAMTVTFLIPMFAILWGWLFLDERPTVAMGIGCVVILAGTALATGLVRRLPRLPVGPPG